MALSPVYPALKGDMECPSRLTTSQSSYDGVFSFINVVINTTKKIKKLPGKKIVIKKTSIKVNAPVCAIVVESYHL